MASFRIRPIKVSEDPLKGPASQLLNWLGDPIDEERMGTVRSRTLSAAMKGTGIPLENVSPPDIQTNIFTCTRFAFLNGMSAAIRGRVTVDLNEFESEIRKIPTGADPFDISPVAEALAKHGVILELPTCRNPILAAEALFSGTAFLVYIDRDYRPIPHALAVVPLESPTDIRFGAKLDSLTGNTIPIDLDEFIRIHLESLERYPFASVYRAIMPA